MSAPQAPSSESRRRPRRGLWIVLSLLVFIVVAAVVAELVTRAVVVATIREQAVERLGLPADQQIDVETEGLVLPQVIGGALTDVEVASDLIQLGPVSGAVRARLGSIPLRDGAAAGGGSGEIRFTRDQVQQLVDGIGSPLPVEVGLSEPDVTVAGVLSVLGARVPVEAALEPTADDGVLLLTPRSVGVSGIELSVDEVRARLGGIAGDLLDGWRICVAEQVPAGLGIESVRVAGEQLIVDVEVSPRIWRDPMALENGSCAAH